jgi:hypothetical protein
MQAVFSPFHGVWLSLDQEKFLKRRGCLDVLYSQNQLPSEAVWPVYLRR